IDVPYKVVINEGVELSKIFGANEAHRFVNGVLDQLAQELRMPEVKHNKQEP
ncbi:MAG: N utilization substance protein B, partial [Reinekea forsetii]|nr:N utilization substance protein B [Reinekea forsetii]